MKIEQNYGIPKEHFEHSQNRPFVLLSGGRIKMSGASPSMYFDQVDDDPMATHQSFLKMRKNPPLGLLMAFFPSDRREMQQRLRGAGLYRHLRMDQGPGGNFGPFRLGNGEGGNYMIVEESGYVVLEELVRLQLENYASASIQLQIDEVRKLFAQNRYVQAADAVKEFTSLCQSDNIELPGGDVNSRNGFFFIRPVEFDRPVEINPELYGQVTEQVEQVLCSLLERAEFLKRLIQSGGTYADSLALAEQHDCGANMYPDLGHSLLYFQPDCMISSDGHVRVEKINIPDVSMFLTSLDDHGNKPFTAVKETNLELREKLKQILSLALEDKPVVIVTRDEVVEDVEDTLENLECSEIYKLLAEIGLPSQIMSLSQFISSNADIEQQVVLMNVDPLHQSYGQFTELIVREEIPCYPHPCIKTLEVSATGYKTHRIDDSMGHLSKFLDLIKPKDYSQKSAQDVSQRLERIFSLSDIQSSILYVKIPGLNQPLPIFRPSLHSHSQIYNSVERSRQSGVHVGEIELLEVPFEPETALISGSDGPRISAIRFFGVANILRGGIHE